jgi:hypothetical protein
LNAPPAGLGRKAGPIVKIDRQPRTGAGSNLVRGADGRLVPSDANAAGVAAPSPVGGPDGYDGPGDRYDAEQSGYDGPGGRDAAAIQPYDSPRQYDGPKKDYDGPTNTSTPNSADRNRSR